MSSTRCEHYYIPICPFIATSPNQIDIEFDPSLFNRKQQQTSSSLDDFIEHVWNEKLEFAKKNNKMLFNAPKLRLHNVVKVMTQNDNDNQHRLHLQIGLTDYKSFIGITEAIRTQKKFLQQELNSATSNMMSFVEATQYFSNIIGVETAVISSDNKAVLFKRSQAVAEYPSAFCFPGGHPEVKNILLEKKRNKLENEQNEASHLTKRDTELVRQEFFGSAIDEIIAEAGLKRHEVIRDSLTLLGISIPNLNRGSKPVACFKVRTTCTIEEMLKARFRAEEKAEFGDHILIVESPEHAHSLFEEEMKRFHDACEDDVNNNKFFEYRYTPATIAILEHF
jgi:hypothetical protein